MKQKQFIKADLYAVVDILAMLAIMLFLFSGKREDKTILMGSYITGMFILIILAIQTKFGQSMVKNNSDEVIYAKPEEGTEPVAVPPHGELYDIDGFKANGKVYKISDGVHARVLKNGITMVISITGYIISKLRGAVILSAPKDGGWQKLFER